MAYDWNHEWAVEDYPFTADVVRMYYDALRERCWALAVDPEADFFGDPTSHTYTPGSATLWGGFGYLQRWLETNCVYFCDPAFDPTAATRHTTGFFYTLDKWRSKCLFTNGFRRRKPREIDDVTNTIDVDGNTAAAGQFAYMQGFLGGSRGLVYRCVAPGNWVRVGASKRPDLLDSHLSVPLHCDPGPGLEADYFGPHILNQVRDGFNALLVASDMGVSVFPEYPDGAPQASFYDPGSTPAAETAGLRLASATRSTYAAAQTACTAAFPGAAIAHTGFGYPIQYSQGDRDDAVDWAATQKCITARLALRDMPAKLNAKVRWWGYVERADIGLPSGDMAYDSSGLPGTPAADAWAKLGEWDFTGSSSNPLYQDWSDGGIDIGDVTTVMPYPVTPTAAHDEKTKGWQVDLRVALRDYSVSGGFTYKPA